MLAPIGPRFVSPSSAPRDSVQLSVVQEAASLEDKLSATEHVEGEVLVKLKGSLFKTDFLQKYGATLVERFDFSDPIFQSFSGDLVRLSLPEGMSTAQALAAMGRDPQVEYATTNDVYYLEDLPNDLDSRLYGLHNTGQHGGKADADIDAPEAWARTTGRREGGPVIAVIDTGIDYNHPDLRNNIWVNKGEIPGDGIDNDGNGVIDDVYGYNAFANNGDPMDGHSHGTHCAGTIAAEGDNGTGVVGVNWQARLMPVKIFSDSGRTTADAIVRGILYATRNGARVTSNSWGGGQSNRAIQEAFAQSPALHIMAAGNDGSNNDRRPHYPSNYDLPNNVAVAATDRRDSLAYFSNYGETSVDLAAPGVDIYSTVPGGGYGSKSGTSMATPHVAGVAGLILSAYPELSNEEVKSRLMRGVDKTLTLDGKVASGGRLNAAASLDNDALPPAAPPDFGVTAASGSRVRLAWTATGDDGWCGPATRYDLRMSDRPIEDFSRATPVAVKAPGEPGSREEVEVSVLPSGTERPVYFALRVLDNVGNASREAHLAATVPASRVAFEDAVDAGGENWTAEGGWARQEVPGKGHVWTDSPEGDYANHADASLVSRPISLADYRECTLMFEARHQLEPGYDKVRLEVAKEGSDWSTLAEFSGESDWKRQVLDLSDYDGETVRLRFHLSTDQSVTAEGFSVDNVLIAGSTTP